MASLPEQHIERVCQERRAKKLMKSSGCCASYAPKAYQKVRAREVRFYSAESMHHQLRLWGLAGLLPPEMAEQFPETKAPEARDDRKARGRRGETEELPPAADTRELFLGAHHLRAHGRHPHSQDPQEAGLELPLTALRLGGRTRAASIGLGPGNPCPGCFHGRPFILKILNSNYAVRPAE